jgi:hypothetical protein
MKVGDLVTHGPSSDVGVIVEKRRRRRGWSCDVYVVLFAYGLGGGTDNNLEVVDESR